jgi:hypothetical protein
VQRQRLQKMRQRELEEKRREEEHDHWFDQARLMVKVRQMWREKRLIGEEGESDGSDSDECQVEQRQDEKSVVEVEVEVSSQPVSGVMNVNMVFVISNEFRAPEREVAEVAAGTERAVFQKPA